jgi:hypothetical protein
MPERIDQLNEGLRKLAEATHEVSTEVARSVNVELEKDRTRREQELERDRRNRRWWMVAIALLMVPTLAMVGLSVVLLLGSRQRGLANRELTKQNQQLLKRIDDCTTPGRACYQESQKRTAGVLQRVVDSEKVVAKCARVATTDAELDTCVDRRIAEMAKGRS